MPRVVPFFRDFIFYIPANLVTAFGTLITIIIVTNIFEPTNFGIYILFLNGTNLCTILFSRWLQQSVIRFLPETKTQGKLESFQSQVLQLLIIISLIIVVMSLMFLFPVDYFNEHFTLLTVCVLYGISSIWFNSVLSFYQASLSSKEFTTFNIYNSVLQLLFVLFFIFLIKPLIVFLFLSPFLSQTILVLIIINKDRIKVFNYNIDWSLIKSFLFYGFPLVGWFLASQILSVSDRYVISYFRGNSEVGIYSATYSIINRGLGLFFSPMLMAAHPLLINKWENSGRQNTQRMTVELIRYFIIFALPIVILFFLLGKYIVTVLLGTNYESGYILVPILTLGFFIWHLSMYLQKGIELSHRTYIMLILLIIIAGLNLLANFLIVPKFGMLGASYTTTFSYLFYAIGIFITSSKYLTIRLKFSFFVKLCIIGVALVIFYKIFHAIVQISPTKWLFLIPIPFLIIYGILLKLFGEISYKNIRKRIFEQCI
ncbi:MAG: oligosaccharide flippase family protein [bacterium]